MWGDWTHIELKSWLDRSSRTFILHGGPLRPVVVGVHPRTLDVRSYLLYIWQTSEEGGEAVAEIVLVMIMVIALGITSDCTRWVSG